MNTKLKTEQNNYLYSIAKSMAMVVLCVALINGCTKKASPSGSSHVALINTVLTNDEKMSILMKSEASHRVPIHEAQQVALAFLGKISPASTTAENMVIGALGNKATVVARVKTFWQVHTVHSTPTPANARGVQATASIDKGVTDSIPIYTFNFENSDGSKTGFAITAGDDRLPTVLACSDNGSLGDTITNPGIAIFLSRLPTYIDSTIAQKNRLYDSLYQIALAKLDSITKLTDTSSVSAFINIKGIGGISMNGGGGIISHYKETITNKTLCAPLLKTEWGQGAPYNRRINRSQGVCFGTTPPVGCVTTAIAQIVAHHKYPNSIEWYVNGNLNTKQNCIFHWDQILSNPRAYLLPRNIQDEVSNLCCIIGDWANISYTCGGSSPDPAQDISQCYIKLGYISDGIQSYNIEKVINSLSQRRPVYVDGEKITSVYLPTVGLTAKISTGHAWVIDGYGQQTKQIDYDITYVMSNMVFQFKPVAARTTEHVTVTNNIATYVHCNWGWNGDYNNAGTYQNGYFLSGAFNVANKNLSDAVTMITNIRPK